MAYLLHLNGPPGIGKSTIARLYVEEHPGVLDCDIDVLRTLIGGWSNHFARAGSLIRPAALGMIEAYLASGQDVVLPQLLIDPAEIALFEEAAARSGAQFIERILMDDPERAVVRFNRRGETGPDDPWHTQVRAIVAAQGAMTHFASATRRCRSWPINAPTPSSSRAMTGLWGRPTNVSSPHLSDQAPSDETRRMAELGYDQDFLGTTLAPPTGGADCSEALDYTHFTVRMHPTRRLAWWVAWNIDGLTLFPSDSVPRSGERFKLDPRIPDDAQTGERAYDDNDLDRGHVARRSDLLWGTTLAEARQASSDSFHFTNITPQRSGFNQSGRGGVWGLLENAVLALEGLEARRLTLFAGPVLAEDDPSYRDIVQLPREHWKIVVYRLDDQVKLKAFLLTQDLDGIEPFAPEDFLEDFDTYQVSLDLLEERTSLEFESLRDAAGPSELRRVTPMLVTDPEQVAPEQVAW